MKFGDAVRYCWRNMFVFQGRARRSEFWWWYLFMSIVSLVIAFIFVFVLIALSIPMILSVNADGSVNGGMFGGSIAAMFLVYGLFFLVAIALNLTLLGATARRLHDMGQSGHWQWLYLAGLGIVPLIMCVMEGQPHDNQYGPDPKAAEREALAQQYQQWAAQRATPPPPPAV